MCDLASQLDGLRSEVLDFIPQLPDEVVVGAVVQGDGALESRKDRRSG